MSWVMVGVAAVGAVKGTMDAKHNKKVQEKNDKFRKQAIMYSPWTGMGDPGSPNVGNTDATSGFLGGAMQGAMMGNALSSGFGGGAAAKPNPANVGMDMSKAQTVGMVDPGVMKGQMGGAMPGMGGSAGAMGSSWGGLKNQGMSMDPTKDLYSGILA